MGSIWLATLEKNGTKYVKGAATTPDKAVEIARSGLARLVHAADEYDMVEVKVANASAVDRQLPYDFPSDADLDSVKRAIAETDAREIEAEQRRERQAAATERWRQHKAAEAEQRRQREAAEAEQRRQREAAEAEADRAWGDAEYGLAEWHQETLKELRLRGYSLNEAREMVIKCDEYRSHQGYVVSPREAVQFVHESERAAAWAARRGGNLPVRD